ncbi:DUF7507 domain-containing protein [Paracoccus alkenifer]|nr:SdrD B-like domain-containing protein [Paracoccus alkenifer]
MLGLGLLAGGAHAQAAGLTLNINDAGFDPTPAGGSIEYSVRVDNGGNTRSAAETLSFAIPAGATYAGTSGGLSDCSPAPDLPGPGTVTCQIPELAPRQSLQGTVLLVPSTAGITTLSGELGAAGPVATEDTTVTMGADLDLSFVAPAEIRAGEFMEFQAVITNNGPYASTGTAFSMPLPASLSTDITMPAGCEIVGNTVSCLITQEIVAGDSITLDFRTQVLTDNASDITVAGSVDSDVTMPPDPDLSNDTGSFSVNVNPGTDVRLGKSRSPSGLVFVGQEVEFTLTPQFSGFAPLAAEITDNLPANYELVDVTATGAGWTCNAVNPVSCHYESAAGDAAEFVKPIIITAMPVADTATGVPVANIAEISAPGDVVPDNNQASDGGADIVQPATDLVARKSGPQHGLVTVGNAYDWRIWTHNAGNVGFAGTLVLTDSLPAGLELTAISAPAGWACSPTTGTGPLTVTCTSDNYTTAAPLGVGAATPAITLTTTVLTTGALENSLNVADENANYDDRDLSNNDIRVGVTSGDDADPDYQYADLRLEKAVADPGPHLAGDPVEFTITLHNDGPGTARDVRVLDRLEDLYFADSTTTGVTLGTQPEGGVCAVTRGSGFYSDLSCTIDELAAGESRVISFTALAGGNAGPKTNSADTYSTQTPDPNFANNAASAAYSVSARTDVTVQKTASHPDDSNVQAGQRLIYVLTASVPDTGLSDAENVTVTDALPPGLRIVGVTPSAGSCGPVSGMVDGITTAGSQLVCNLGTVTNGNARTVSIETVPSTGIANTTIINPVTVSTSTVEMDPANNAHQIRHHITQPSLDLITNKTDSADPLEVGNPTVYTVTVHNAGPSEAFDLVITDTLPAEGMRYDEIVSTSAGLVCAPVGAAPGSIGGQISCELPNLPVGETAEFQVQMTATERGRWTNHVQARSAEYDHEPLKTNNDVDETTAVFERANLKVTKVADPASVDLNEPFDWTITVENDTAVGIGLAENVVLADTLPANMEITGAVGTSGVGASCDAPIGGRDLICIIDDMQAGDLLTITLPVRVTAITASPQGFDNTAAVTTDSFEQDVSDNSATGAVEVSGASVSGAIWRDFNEDLARAAHDSGIAGLELALTGTDEWGNPVSRSISTDADGNYAFDLLPPGTYQVSYTPPTGDAYELGSALPGAVGGGTANDQTTIGAITVTTAAGATGNDFTLVPQAQIALSKQLAAPALQADGSYALTYTFRIRNDSQEPVSDLTLTDTLDSDFGSLVTGTPDHGQFSIGTPGGATVLASSDTGITLEIAGPVAAGATHTVAMELLVNPPLPRVAPSQTFTNNAEIEGNGDWSTQTPGDQSNDGANPVHGSQSPTSDTVDFTPAISVEKTAVLDGDDAAAAPGDVVSYSFTITNTGNTPLVDVTLADPLPGLVWDTTGTIARLNPGEQDTSTFTAHYVLTQDDIEAGGVDNTATALGRWAVDGVDDPTVSAADSANITALNEPGLTVVKAEVSHTVQEPTVIGDTIRYSFTITNTGNVELRDLVLTDAIAVAPDPAGSFSIGTLARAGQPGDTVTLYADYLVTQDDIDAGTVLNTAFVTGAHGPDDTPITAGSNEVETPLHPDPKMRVTKLPVEPLPDTPRAGDTISWTISIENTGNTRLQIGTITEPLANTTVGAPALTVLQPGDSTTATATHTLSQAEIDAGEVRNQVTVAGEVPGSGIPFKPTPSGNDPDDPNEDETVTPLPAVPSIALQKVLTSDVSEPLMPGAVIEFDFTIRNTGNVTLDNLVLTDDLADVELDDAALAGLSLAPAGEVTVTGSYVLTAADIEAGGLDNTATVTGDAPDGTGVEDDSGTGFDNDDPTPVTLLRNPQIALIKTISVAPTAPVGAGDQIEYAFEIRNTGNVALQNIDLTELVGGITLTGSRSAPLAVGEVDTDSFTGLYTLTQTDIDAGSFANSAEVSGTGTGPDGDPQQVTDISGTGVDNDTPTELLITPEPALEIVKEADDSQVTSPAAVNDLITYSFTVTNTGSVTLTDVTVTDPLLGGMFADNVIASLAPGAHEVLSAEYRVTADDIENGLVANTASVTGEYFDRETGGPLTTPPVNSEEIIVPLDQLPHLAVVKTADASAVTEPAQVGQVITYSFTVTNIGNVTIEDVDLTDPLPGLSQGSFTIGTLAPEASQTVTATYALTQADIDAAEVVNQAQATGSHEDEPVTDLSGPDLTTDEETVVPLVQAPGLDLVKHADGSALGDPAVAGQEISYSFTVTNTGNVTLTEVVVDDPLPGLSPGSFTIGELAPGAEVTVGPAVYAITEADIIAGNVSNRALASGVYGPPDDPQPFETPSRNDEGEEGPNVVPVISQPGIALVKQLAADIDPDSLTLGSEVRWTFTVTNIGNVPLDEVTVTEEMIGATVSGGPISLAVGASDSSSFTASYMVAQADLDAGQIINQARADGVFEDGDGTRHPVTDTSGTDLDNDDPTQTPLMQNPGIDLVKLADVSGLGDPAVAGQEVVYSFTVTNTGNVTLTDVVVDDPLPGLVLSGGPIASLAPDAVDTLTFSGRYALTQGDIDSGRTLENQATVTGNYTDPDGDPGQVTDLSGTETGTDQPTTVEFARLPGLELVKSADDSGISEVAQAGEEIIYSFTVTNTGNVTLTDVVVEDPLPGLVLSGAPIASLAPGETSEAITGVYAITAEDIIAAERPNTATASAVWTPEDGEPVEVESEESTAVVELGYPEIAFEITIGELRDLNGDGLMGEGDEVVFRFRVTNTGTVPLNDVDVDRSSLSLPLPGLVCTPVTLAPGESAFLECSGAGHIITAGDAARGEITLTGDATGASDAGVVVRASSAAATVPNIAAGGLALEKVAGVETAMIGDVVPYTIHVSNAAEGVAVSARLIDRLPEGFTYVAGTARLDGVPVEVEDSGRRIILDPVDILPGQTRALTLDARVGGSAKPGLHVNRAQLVSRITGAQIAPEASAPVRILADAVLQCSTVLGRVFDDRDQNGHMSRADEERGLPNVRLVAPNGLAIVTDAHGRFSVPCAAMPRAIGSNFMLKLDERTLPAGYRLTTENPRIVRVTPGMITRLDFGATLARLVRIDLAANAFDQGEMRPALRDGLRKMVGEIRDQAVMLRVTYLLAPQESEQAARRHLRLVEQQVRKLWSGEGRYKLNVETLIQRAGAAR